MRFEGLSLVGSGARIRIYIYICVRVRIIHNLTDSFLVALKSNSPGPPPHPSTVTQSISIAALPGHQSVKLSNLLIARFSLILLLAIATSVFWTVPWPLKFEFLAWAWEGWSAQNRSDLHICIFIYSIV